MASRSAEEIPFEEYWEWVAVTLFLFITADMITTFYAVKLYGYGFESNPILRWAFKEGFIVVILLNTLSTVLSVGLFYGIIENIKQAPEKHQKMLSLSFEVFIGLLVSVGFFIFVNNLFVIFFGSSIL